MNVRASILVGLFTWGAAVGAYASPATVDAEVDWSRMTYITTGDLTFAIEQRPISQSEAVSWVQVTGIPTVVKTRVSADDSGSLNYVEDGLSANLTNNPSMQRTILTSELDDNAHALTRSVTLVTLTGTGSVTFNIPYEYHLTMGDGVHATSYVSAFLGQSSRGPNYHDQSAISPWPSLNYGVTDKQGIITYTLNGSGGVTSTSISVFAGAIITSVPEPETYAMVGMGLALVFIARRKRAA